MAHFWFHVNSVHHCWSIVQLFETVKGYSLGGDPLAPVCIVNGSGATAYVSAHNTSQQQTRWVLYSAVSSHVYVNGVHLNLGIYILRDKDELIVDNCGPLLFASYVPACIVEFPGMDNPVTCPRCKVLITKGYPSVKCPTCGIWHHQSKEKPCFTYAETCAYCKKQKTSLDIDYDWTPEDLHGVENG